MRILLLLFVRHSTVIYFTINRSRFKRSRYSVVIPQNCKSALVHDFETVVKVNLQVTSVPVLSPADRWRGVYWSASASGSTLTETVCGTERSWRPPPDRRTAPIRRRRQINLLIERRRFLSASERYCSSSASSAAAEHASTVSAFSVLSVTFLTLLHPYQSLL